MNIDGNSNTDSNKTVIYTEVPVQREEDDHVFYRVGSVTAKGVFVENDEA